MKQSKQYSKQHPTELICYSPKRIGSNIQNLNFKFKTIPEYLQWMKLRSFTTATNISCTNRGNGFKYFASSSSSSSSHSEPSPSANTKEPTCRFRMAVLSSSALHVAAAIFFLRAGTGGGGGGFEPVYLVAAATGTGFGAGTATTGAFAHSISSSVFSSTTSFSFRATTIDLDSETSDSATFTENGSDEFSHPSKSLIQKNGIYSPNPSTVLLDSDTIRNNGKTMNVRNGHDVGKNSVLHHLLQDSRDTNGSSSNNNIIKAGTGLRSPSYSSPSTRSQGIINLDKSGALNGKVKPTNITPNGKNENTNFLSTQSTTITNKLQSLIISKFPSLSDTANGKLEPKSISESSSKAASDSATIKKPNSIRKLWKRRHARSIEEGIRRERTDTGKQLSNLIEEHALSDGGDDKQNANFTSDRAISTNTNRESSTVSNSKKTKRKYAARTIAGLIVALAEEATGLEVEVDACEETPFWDKQVNAIRINFSRLGFKPLRMGGLDSTLNDDEIYGSGSVNGSNDKKNNKRSELGSELVEDMTKNLMQNQKAFGSWTSSPDETFDRIDTDKSGALDEEELARALSLAAGGENIGADLKSGGERITVNGGNLSDGDGKRMLSRLASRLVHLYDANGDGVVDREEYKNMVKDMDALRKAIAIKKKKREEKRRERMERKMRKNFDREHRLKWNRIGGIRGIRRTFGRAFSNAVGRVTGTQTDGIARDSRANDGISYTGQNERNSTDYVGFDESGGINFEAAENLPEDTRLFSRMTNGEGSVVLSDLKLDLRRLLFGALPWVKRITPGGPLILEPMTVSITASLNREDIMESILIDDGLRRLVARALRRRVRSIRDLVDGAVFYGRTWNMASKQAPVVDVPKLTNVEFDKQNRLIITGRARLRTSPDQPFIENSFKLRTKLGTREGGQYIRLKEPELALILECPKAWERNIVSACKNLNLPIPSRPEPLYTFFPLVSPLKATEQDGFNLGEDNRIKSIYIQDGALRFEIASVLRPGRFLGNHYLAFTVPNRTFIITMDRVKEGIRVARRNKRLREEAAKKQEDEKLQNVNESYNEAVAQALSSEELLSFKKEAEETQVEEKFSFNDPDDGEVKSNTLVVPNRQSFFGRFLEGYLEAAREESEEEKNEQLVTAISTFFGSEDVDNI